jgi:transcriptional regulator of acetoin/glycerol metabolism
VIPLAPKQVKEVQGDRSELMSGDASSSAASATVHKLPSLVRRSQVDVGDGEVQTTSSSDSARGSSYTLMKKKWIETFEVDYLQQLLNHHSGNVSAAARAARLDRSNFLRLLRKYGLKAEAYRAKMAA